MELWLAAAGLISLALLAAAICHAGIAALLPEEVNCAADEAGLLADTEAEVGTADAEFVYAGVGLGAFAAGAFSALGVAAVLVEVEALDPGNVPG